MRSNARTALVWAGTGVALILLVRLVPIVGAFAEGAALSIRRFWAVILLVLLAGWAIWALRKPRGPKSPGAQIYEGHFRRQRSKDDDEKPN